MVYFLKEPYSSIKLANALGLRVVGEDVLIQSISSVSTLESGCLAFSKAPVSIGQDMVVIGLGHFASQQASLLESTTPRLDFIRALDYLERMVGFNLYDFESQIHSSARIGKNVVIERGCIIEEGVVLEANVVIHSGSTIGAYTRIRANASIGGDGFGFERLECGKPIRFVHLGGGVIGQHVEIGSNSCIVRGTLGNTVVENHVKIDNLVHLAHNCYVEEGAFIIACAEVSGGVRVGKNAWIGPNVSILQKLVVGEGALIGLGAVLTKSADPHSIYVGNPAKFIRKI